MVLNQRFQSIIKLCVPGTPCVPGTRTPNSYGTRIVDSDRHPGYRGCQRVGLGENTALDYLSNL